MAGRTRSEEELRLRAVTKTLVDSIDGSYRRDGFLLLSEWKFMCELQRFVRAEFERREKADKLSIQTEMASKLSNHLGFLMHEWSRSKQYIDMQKRDLETVREDLRTEIERQKAETANPDV